MRILYVITRAEHGGAQSHLLELVRGVSTQHEVRVAVGEEGFLTERLCRLGLGYETLKHLKHPVSPWHDVAGVRELLQLIRRIEPDLVHTHSGKAGLLGRIAAHLEHVPSVHTAHGFAFNDDEPLLRKLPAVGGEWLGARAGNFTIAVSEAECRLATSYDMLPSLGATVIPNGITAHDRCARPHIQPPVITMVARFAYPKQQELLIRAFRRLAGEAQLWLVGDGPGRPAAELAARTAGQQNRILFWGRRDDVNELLAQSQIGVLVSSHEAFGLSLVEAMSLGLPVVATDCGGTREIVVEGQTGFLVPPNDEVQLAAALHRLCVDPQLRVQMGREGRQRYGAEFTAKEMIRRTLGVYEAVLSSSRATAHIACAACSCAQPCRRQRFASGD